MSFLRVKKRVKFNVELVVVSLSDVPLLSAIIFAKVRLLECGSFEGFTWHRPVQAYRVNFIDSLELNSKKTKFTEFVNFSNNFNNERLNSLEPENEKNPQPFQFQCRIPFDEKTGELEECRCKISLRKEDRCGRSPQKLGFVVLNLSEFAASGNTGILQSFLLDGYTANGQRPDNSRVNVQIKMIHQALDPLFKVPNLFFNTSEETQLNPADRKAPSSSSFLKTSTNVLGLGPNDKDANLEKNHKLTFRPISCNNFALTTPQEKTSELLNENRASWHADSITQPTSIKKLFCPLKDNKNVIKLFDTESSNRKSIGFLKKQIENCENVTSSLSSSMSVTPSRNLGVISTTVANGLNTSTLTSFTNRIQKTRRDASNVIEEVFAETSALLANEKASTSTPIFRQIIEDSDCFSGDDSLIENENVNKEFRKRIVSLPFQNKTYHHLMFDQHLTHNINNEDKNTVEAGGRLALLISKDGKSASVTSETDLKLNKTEKSKFL